MTKGDGVLVVGGDGLIGAALITELAARGHPAHWTTRRDRHTPQATVLDLASAAAIDRFVIPAGIGAAVMLAAQTRIEACEKDPAAARRVNVDATARLAGRLAEHGIRVLLLSTSRVFDGSSPLVAEYAPVSPETEYGRQKADAEQAILALPGGAVLRVAKVVDTRHSLFADWATALSDGQPVSAFTDMTVAPVSLPLTVETILRMAEGQPSGVYHLSANADNSYFDAARHLCERLGQGLDLVRPTTAAEAGIAPLFAPTFTSLGGTRLHAAFGLKAPSLDELLEYIATTAQTVAKSRLS